MKSTTIIVMLAVISLTVAGIITVSEESEAANPIQINSSTIEDYVNDENTQYRLTDGDYVLGSELSLDKPIVFSGTCTLDLAGEPIITSSRDALVVASGQLIINDSSSDRSGSVKTTYTDSNSRAVFTQDKVIVNGGTFTGYFGVIGASNTQPSITVNGGLYDCTQCIRIDSGTAKITDGTFKGSSFGAVVSGTGEMVISGGIFESNTGAQAQIGGKLTVDGGTFNTTTFGIAAISTSDSTVTEIVVNDVDINSQDTGIIVQGGGSEESNASLNFVDGSIDAVVYGITGNGNSDYTEIAVNGGTINVSDGFAIYHPQIGNLTISGGSLTGSSGVQFCGVGNLTISGGIITATADVDAPTKSESDNDGAITDGAAVSIVSRGNGYQVHDGIEGKISVTITGGTFTSEHSSPIQSYRVKGTSNGDDTTDWSFGDDSNLNTFVESVRVSGGNFIATDETRSVIAFDQGETVSDQSAYDVFGGTFTGTLDQNLLNEDYRLNESTGQVTPEEGKSVFLIGDQQFASLSDAAEAAHANDIIVMTVNYELTETVTFDVPVVINLGGNTLKINVTNGVGDGICFTNGKNVIRNGTIDHISTSSMSNAAAISSLNKGTKVSIDALTITIYESSSGFTYGLFVNNGASAVLSNGTNITGVAGDGDGVTTGVLIQGNGVEGETSLTIYEGVTIDTTGYAISGNGNRHGTSITINGGQINSDTTAIYNPQNGSLEINGGTIIGESTGIEIRAGSLTMNDGTVIGMGSETVSTPNGDGVTTSGAGIAIVQHTTKLPIEVNIIGGTVQGATALYENNTQSNAPEDIQKIEIAVSGGTFEGTGENGVAVNVADVGDFITGGSFNTEPSQDYIPDGITTENDPDTGNVVVISPLSFEYDYVIVYGDSYKPSLTVNGDLDVTFSVSEGATVTQDGTVVKAEGYDEENGCVLTATATVGGTQVSTSMTIQFVPSITSSETELVVIMTIDVYTEIQDYAEEIQSLVPGIDSQGLIMTMIDVSRVDGDRTGVPFTVDMPVGSNAEDYTFFVVHIASSGPELLDCTTSDGTIAVSPDSFSTFIIFAVPNSDVPEPEPEPTPDPDPGWNPGWSDDDDYVPPIYVPSDTSSSDDDTVKIVACAAAAVVAAIMAAFLILGHRRE